MHRVVSITRVATLISRMRHVHAWPSPDGSFRYEGPFRRGHFENTASGYEAERAAKMLDWAVLIRSLLQSRHFASRYQ
jgi:hypothetical protein